MSLNGEMSVTLHSTRYLQDVYAKKNETFEEIVMPKNGAVSDEMLQKFKDADLVVFATSMYHFMIASQAMNAMTAIGEFMKTACPGKPVTYFMTSNFLMDVLVHRYVENWTKRWGMHFIKGISIFSDDMIEEKFRADVYAWFNGVISLVENKTVTAKRELAAKLVVLDETAGTSALAGQYRSALQTAGATVTDIDMTKYNFTHCLGCQFCYTTRVCCINDDFNKLSKDIEADTDIIIYVGAVEDGFYPSVFKRFMDRHVCMGRCPGNDEIITVYAYHKGGRFTPGDDELFRQWATACTSFGGEILTGICEGFSQDAVNASVAAFNENIAPYRDFYKAALFTRFGELARVIHNIEPLDYECFKSLGCYVVEPVNEQCRPITNAAEAKSSVEMKSMAVRMFRTQAKELDVPIPERRTDKHRSMIERAIDPPYKNGSDVPDDTKLRSASSKAGPGAVSGPMMGKMMRKVGKRMGLLMNTFNTIVFSTIGTLSSGHFSWLGWLVGACVGWITGALITSFIDVKETQDKVHAKTGTSPDSFKGKLLASLTTSAIIMPVMTIVMSLSMPLLSVSNMEKGIAETRTEIVQMQQEQNALKDQQHELLIQQAELKGKRDAMQSDVDSLQKLVSEAQTPAEKAPLEGQLKAKQGALAEMQAGIDNMQTGISDMQGGIDGMQNGINGKTESITGREQAIEGIKRSLPISIPISAVVNTLIGVILGIFTQPLFTKIVMRSVFGKNPPPM